MKKVIFLLFVLKSFLFSSYLVYFTNTNGYMTCTQNNLTVSDFPNAVRDDNNPTFQFLGYSTSLNSNAYYPGSSYRVYWGCSPVCDSGSSYDSSKLACIPTSCPTGQEIIGYSCAVPPACTAPQIWNSSTDTCECPSRPTGYKVDVPLTEENCNITQASLLLSDSGANGLTTYIVDVLWDSCRGVCMGKTAECPCNTALFNGACVDIAPPSGSCPDGSIFKNIGLGVGTGIQCSKVYYSADSGFICFEAPAGCCTGDSGSSQPDSNTTNPDSNTSTPAPGDSNTSTPNDGEDGNEDGEEDGGETGGGDSNTSTPAPGDSNTSTPAPGDSNTSTPGDSNSTAGTGEYEDSDADKEGKGKIGEALNDAYDTLDKMKQDYERMMTRLESGVTPISLSFGSAPIFCANVFGKQVCINLCDSFGYFYSILYYIFLALFTVMALRIYYTAFKMR